MRLQEGILLTGARLNLAPVAVQHVAPDEVDGILHAGTTADWKPITNQRLAALDEQIAQLRHARALLADALHCPFDHPATDCKTMGAEIDRRLYGTGAL